MPLTDRHTRVRDLLIPAGLLAGILLVAACGSSSEPDDDPDPPVALGVDSIVPGNGLSNVEITAPLRLYFDAAADPATVSTSTVTLRTLGALLPTVVTYDAASHSAHVLGPLLPGAEYTLTATTGVENVDGTALPAAASVTFATRDPNIITLNPMVSTDPPSIAPRPDGGMVVLYKGTQVLAVICNANCTQIGSGSSVPIDSIAGSIPGDVAVDGAGVIHATYTDPNTDRLHYARCASACDIRTSWTTTVVDSSVYAHSANAIAVDGNTVHIIYDASGPSDVRYATCSANCATYAGWTRGAAETAGSVGGIHKLIVSGGVLHTAWYDFTAQRLKYATCTTGCTAPAGWTSAPIDQAGTQGNYPSLGVGPTGTLYIAYSTNSPGVMMLASCTAACTTAASWTRTTIADMGGSGATESGLLVSADGRLGLVHFKTSTADLRYSTCVTNCTVSGNWRTTDLDTTGDVGYHPTAVLGSDGRLQAAYTTQTSLKYVE